MIRRIVQAGILILGISATPFTVDAGERKPAWKSVIERNGFVGVPSSDGYHEGFVVAPQTEPSIVVSLKWSFMCATPYQAVQVARELNWIEAGCGAVVTKNGVDLSITMSPGSPFPGIHGEKFITVKITKLEGEAIGPYYTFLRTETFDQLLQPLANPTKSPGICVPEFGQTPTFCG